MFFSLNVHNIKISLKLESPYLSYINEKITKNKNIKQINFDNFCVVNSHLTYIFFNTSTNVLHCNVTRIKKYNQIFTAKKYLKNFFPQINILSTKVDNICATKTIKGKGFTFSENNNDWHHKIMTKETYDNAIKELKLDEN